MSASQPAGNGTALRRRNGRARPAAAARPARGTAKPAKRAARPAKRAARASATAGPPVMVRMYRQGLGDCFLLTFGKGAAARHVLIDCGTLGATTTPQNKMEKVVADIRAVTKDHLTVLVATHEHKDHLSGFNSREKDFRQMTVDHVWLAWTEDPADDLAERISVYKNDLALALGAAVRAAIGDAAAQSEPADDDNKARVGAPAAGSASREVALAARDLLGFAGNAKMLGADKFAETIDEAMKFVRDGLGAKPTYHKPGGRPVELPEIPGFRFYVLGPPRDEAALKELGGEGSSHLYGLRTAAYGQIPALKDEQKEECEREMPFDQRFRHVRSGKEFVSAYPAYLAEADAWRRIDEDWQQATADLALQLDSLTNNTSLALAVERIADGRVLLFPADAQQGNWLSWHKLSWSVRDAGGATRTVTARDLLDRTVFYKVGHHGSHNATVKEQGLGLMNRKQELVAFIPVDRAVAMGRNPKKSWKMPARALYRELLNRCDGRVARSDIGWAADAKEADDKATEEELLGVANRAEWKAWEKAQNAAKHVRATPLFIEYTLK